MAIETEIGWCDSSVNPVVGCDGCELHRAGHAESHCYAAGLVGRYKGLPGWPKSFDVPEHFAGRLDKAIKWPDLTGKDRAVKPWLNGYPRLIFMCDLADPFSESLDSEWLTSYLPKMADSPHVYIMLTKRSGRMLSYWQKHEIPKNVWQGVTVTGPQTANRLDSLMAVPGASVRFASMEPLLGPPVRGLGNLDWVIVGGESGPGARPMNPQWARELRDMCGRTGKAFFFKQWGEWGPLDTPDYTRRYFDFDQNAQRVWGIGKKSAGRLLDGREWSEMPRAA